MSTGLAAQDTSRLSCGCPPELLSEKSEKCSCTRLLWSVVILSKRPVPRQSLENITEA